VISIKTLDLGARTYQNLERLQRVVQGYIQKLAEFQGERFAGIRIRPEDIKIKELWLAIPGANEGQWRVLQSLQEAALKANIILTLLSANFADTPIYGQKSEKPALQTIYGPPIYGQKWQFSCE